ncbi:E3 ubiquitin-protein ligase TRIM71 isoform X2 [Lepeophtheirus salmonis]|uniref:E3 ubiquitin-protein ligase TRIM71 isoform X2 n=1 Tax=Lepeophtheirus salmonis TaxID=72036 RepID=UPI003AF35870
MTTSSSTLVETVSIDYEDFNESFLTCGTCLCMYDGSEHTPKLLPCSHTVCLQCLDRIIATFARDSGQFRCPICRELITIPRGGIQALPPSFLVNQLLDLMAKQRREIVPKCSNHPNQELLFCETCDKVFCNQCTGGNHETSSGFLSEGSDGSNSSTPKHISKFISNDHTVIPFAIAIKRMSEILIYKANECTSKLNDACDAVNLEVDNLDRNANEAYNAVNREFKLVSEALEAERKDVMEAVKKARDEKKKVLEEQLSLINSEKTKVEADIKASQQQIEVRSITKKIADLNCKLDALSMLSEPRENSFIEFHLNNKKVSEGLTKLLSTLGSIKTTHIENLAKVQAIDYNGSVQSLGGDPISATVWDSSGNEIKSVHLKDNCDGTYDICFTLHLVGTYCLKVLIFGRPIKDMPLFFDVNDHNPPTLSFGSRGTKEKGFMQPCNVAVDTSHGNVYVIDTGNSRIKVLSENLNFVRHITNEGLEGRSVTGICLNGRTSCKSLFVINWRTKTVTELSISSGETLFSFTHQDFQEPIDLAYWKASEEEDDKILVADNGLGTILVFDAKSGEISFSIKPPFPSAIAASSNKAKKSIVSKNNANNINNCQNRIERFRDLTAVCVAPSRGDILVAANSNIFIFDGRGSYLRKIETSEKGRFVGVAADSFGFLLATRSEKAKSFIQVFDFDKGTQYSIIDSYGSKMKRPTGLAVFPNKHVLVVDIGNDCVKKYSEIYDFWFFSSDRWDKNIDLETTQNKLLVVLYSDVKFNLCITVFFVNIFPKIYIYL